MFIVLCVLVYYRVMPTWNFLLFPMLMLYMEIGDRHRFRAVNHGDGGSIQGCATGHAGFFIRSFMYSPVVYPFSSIPEPYRLYYSLKTLVGVIEGFRSCLLGTAVPWIPIYLGFGEGPWS